MTWCLKARQRSEAVFVNGLMTCYLNARQHSDAFWAMNIIRIND
jgi:hypothetical protein